MVECVNQGWYFLKRVLSLCCCDVSCKRVSFPQFFFETTPIETHVRFNARRMLTRSTLVQVCKSLVHGTECVQRLRIPGAANYATSSALFKDKNFKDAGAGPRKSKFAKNDSDDAAPKKIRTEEELKKLKEERLAREEKKKEIQKKQLEIQRKREEAKLNKASKAKKNNHGDDGDDD